jgi:hypothetical protein
MQRILLALVVFSIAAETGWAQASLQGANHTTIVASASGAAYTAGPPASEEVQNNLAELTAIHRRTVEALSRMATIYDSLNSRLEEICGPDRRDIWASAETDQLEHACRTSAHDMLEYSELEDRMYSENLRFTALRAAMEAQTNAVGNAIP